jgi:hypothetical protein
MGDTLPLTCAKSQDYTKRFAINDRIKIATKSDKSSPTAPIRTGGRIRRSGRRTGSVRAVNVLTTLLRSEDWYRTCGGTHEEIARKTRTRMYAWSSEARSDTT